MVQNRDLLLNFWKFLDRPTPLNPLQASYFTKVNEQFLEKKTDEVEAVSHRWLIIDDTFYQVDPPYCPQIAPSY